VSEVPSDSAFGLGENGFALIASKLDDELVSVEKELSVS
jgi:hypothetical protein